MMENSKEFSLHMAALNAQPTDAEAVIAAAKIYHEQFLRDDATPVDLPVETEADLLPKELNDIALNAAAKRYAGFKGLIWDKITEEDRRQMVWAVKQILLAAKNAPKADV